jgi:hypothetical protein
MYSVSFKFFFSLRSLCLCGKKIHLCLKFVSHAMHRFNPAR